MSFANVTDIVATTLESRTRKIADNITKNNALLAKLKRKGKVKPVSGGSSIMQELSQAENGNFMWYSGYDTLSVAAQDVISAASFSFKQAAVAVTISGLEEAQNSGKEQVIDLLESRIDIAESTMANKLSEGAYSDGTGSGGKQVSGLAAYLLATPTSGTAGGIDRATWTFWRNKVTDASGYTVDTIRRYMNQLWVQCVRGKDRPDLIIFDNTLYTYYLESLQGLQRFAGTDEAGFGFPTLKYMDADVVLDGGIGGFCPTNVGYFLNTNHIFWRPHKDRDVVPLNPNRRTAVNQDATVNILAWMGNMTVDNMSLQGRLKGA